MVNTPRRLTVQILYRIVVERRSLTSTLATKLPRLSKQHDLAFCRALSYGTLRWYFRLNFILSRLLNRPLAAKHEDIRILALLGLFQLGFTRVKPYAAVSETVAAVGKKTWARPLLNGVLRNYQRDRRTIDGLVLKDCVARTAHPIWLIDKITEDWPDQSERIMQQNNQQPPMTLRVNRRAGNRDAYIDMLTSRGINCDRSEFGSDGILLNKAIDTAKLPGFSKGLVSVQDSAAQLAASLLKIEAGNRVLDTCAAPGGKTAHILERFPEIDELVAVDIDLARLNRIRDNLNRGRLNATLVHGDATKPSKWWDGRFFHRILVDAPCSATGVIRRHPDIRLLRSNEDISNLVHLQYSILEAVWPMLMNGGILLYITCSILRAENDDQIAKFLMEHPNARQNSIDADWGHTLRFGRQILPGDSDMDGFYYARLSKQ